MVIKDYYSPEPPGAISGESLVFKRGIGHLLEEIRQSILQTRLIISPKLTKKKGKGATGSPGLAAALNKALGLSLTSLNWLPRKAPGATSSKAEVDWCKSVPSQLTYGPKRIGLGLEVQFGNNFQFNEDLKRLTEAMLEQSIAAGVSVVACDELAKYKADRGASFSDARSKLDRFLNVLVGAGAAIIPGFILIGVGQDGFTNKEDGLFQLTAPRFDPDRGCQQKPIEWCEFGTLSQ